jgi:hypothetical protein
MYPEENLDLLVKETINSDIPLLLLISYRLLNISSLSFCNSSCTRALCYKNVIEHGILLLDEGKSQISQGCDPGSHIVSEHFRSLDVAFGSADGLQQPTEHQGGVPIRQNLLTRGMARLKELL